MMTLPRHLLGAALLAVCLPAAAVYRCEVNGRTLYGDAPCEGGTVLPPLPAAATEEAKERAAKEKKTLAEIERATEKEEGAARKRQQRQARADTSVRKRCDKLAARAAWAMEEARKAGGKNAGNARRRAEQASTQHKSECAELEKQREALISTGS